MLASVIIVNWRVRDLLRSCLRSVLAERTLEPGGLEVFVVDNDSRDGSVEMLRTEFPQVRLIANDRNVGFAAANNQALPLCSGRYVLLLNPDTVVPGGALPGLLAHIDACPDVGAMGPRLLNGDGSLQRWTGGAFPTVGNVARHYLFVDRLVPPGLRARSLYLDRDTDRDLDVDWVSGACMALRRDALEGKLFDPSFFMYGEDMELCHRLKRAGWRVVYTPVASIVHYQGASMKQQQGDILLSSLKGLRAFYAMVGSPRWLPLIDALTVCGFLLRWVIYRAAAFVGSDARYLEKARSSRRYLGLAMHLMGTDRR